MSTPFPVKLRTMYSSSIPAMEEEISPATEEAISQTKMGADVKSLCKEQHVLIIARGPIRHDDKVVIGVIKEMRPDLRQK